MTTRVLLVDDSEDLRLLCRIVLESDGAFVVIAEASNGAEAIKAAAVDRPDVIVLDIEMPVMDGFTALPRLLELHPDVPVIMLSAGVTAKRQDKAIRLGAHALVGKDPAMAELQRLLHGLRARTVVAR